MQNLIRKQFKCRLCKQILARLNYCESNLKRWDYRCRKCATQQNKRWPEVRRRYRRAHSAANRSLINQLKSKPCADCQGWYQPCQMQFDHRDRAKKNFNISEFRNKSRNVILQEVRKCDVVCANCHSLRTHNRQDWKPLSAVVLEVMCQSPTVS